MLTVSRKMYSKVIDISEIKDIEKIQMLELMNEFYDDVFEEVFYKDLMDKDHCIMLYNEEGIVKGFSSQKEITLNVGGKMIRGVFSGDTIIDKDYWGSLDLYREFARRFIKEDEDFYWFLISKGYKTYKMLPVFFRNFYPNYKNQTPAFEKEIMDTFGQTLYAKDYDKESGIIKYKDLKDKLKSGVADITQRQLRDKDIKCFLAKNPNYGDGDDLVCLTNLRESNLRKTAQRLLREDKYDK